MTGILDEYPGAAAAYSLRLLNTDYTGDAVIVRRASDNATQNIGFVDGELDTGALNTFCSGTDGFVATWYDQSGNGNNAANTTASGQPKIFDSATGVILDNGKPAMDFEPIKFFTTTSVIDYETAFTVANLETVSNYSYLLYSTTGNKGIGYNVSAFGLFFYNGTGTRLLTSQDTNQLLAFFDNDGSTLKIAKNGESETTYSETTYSETVKFAFNYVARQFNGLDFKGLVQEIVVYTDSQLTNRTGIETNINDFYSIY